MTTRSTRSSIDRRPWLRWSLRIALLFASTEGGLAAASRVVERFQRSSAAPSADGALVCIGDSHTFGIGAPSGRSYPDQLQELLRAAGDPRTVTNLGVAGFTSRQAIDRLEEALATIHPSCVLFRGGMNDAMHAPLGVGQLRSEPTVADRVGAALASLRTFRVLQAAWRIASGDLAHFDAGGADERPLPVADSVPYKQWDAEYARARAAGAAALGEWLQLFWRVQDPQRLRSAFDDFRASAGFAEVQGCLRYPLPLVEWELRWLESAAAPSGPLPEGGGEPGDFANHATACGRLADGALDEARRLLATKPPIGSGPHGRLFQSLHLAWSRLLERDWARAESELGAVLESSLAISPDVAVPHLLGAISLAHLLRPEPEARLADVLGPRRELWQRRKETTWVPLGREWMACAELIDAIKGGASAQQRAPLVADARRRFAAPLTRPLRWLLDHADATLDAVRAELELEPCRVAWLGTCNMLFRAAGEREFQVMIEAQHERLVRLARDHHFSIVALTYIVDDMKFINDGLRKAAADRGWPLVDLHVSRTLEDLYADDRKRYLSPDRAHPNAAGYALEAQAAFELLRR